MLEQTLFRDRPRGVQIVLGGVIPALLGVAAGILVGASTGAYWALAAVVSIGGLLAGFEHEDGWGGADRGLVGGALYGASLLIAHAIAGTEAKVSLGSFPPFLAVVTAIVGMLLGALEPQIRGLAREVLAALEQSADERGVLTVTLAPQQMKITHSAVRLLLNDLQREQAEEREVLHAILAKLPDEHTMRAIAIG